MEGVFVQSGRIIMPLKTVAGTISRYRKAQKLGEMKPLENYEKILQDFYDTEEIIWGGTIPLACEKAIIEENTRAVENNPAILSSSEVDRILKEIMLNSNET